MAVPTKHILQQGPVLAALGRAALSSVLDKNALRRRSETPPSTPGPMIEAELPPRSVSLVRDYVRAVGGDPAAYRDVLPPHLFPHWGFALASRTLAGIPYPLIKVMNGGCRLDIRAPLPVDERLRVSARLESIDDNGRRAVLQQRIITGTESTPEALIADLFAIVPLAQKNGEKKKKERPRVPTDARELAYWKIGRRAGLDFAKLTGDFNPIHWSVAYARASGFKSTILHGFATMARAYEGLLKAHAGRTAIRTLDVQFTRPLLLPARVGLYTTDDDGIFVGDAAGGPAYLVGRYQGR